MGTAYFAPQVGSALSSTVSSAFIDAGFNEAFTEVASNSISKGLVNGTIAEIKGQDFNDGFAGGFTGGLVAGGVGEVGSYVKDDVIALAQESGLDLKDATSLYNAGTRAVSAGITSEITGNGTFATSFTNSALGSGINAGTASLNSTIDDQFKTAATDWNEKDKEGDKVDTTVTGAGIPNDVVGQVTVSSIGVDATADTNLIETKSDSTSNVANVLADSSDTTGTTAGEIATSNISTLPETQLAQAPTGETVTDFTDIIGAQTPTGGSTVVASSTDGTSEVPASVIDIADTLPTGSETVASTEPKGGLTTLAEASTTPVVDLTDLTKPAVVSEAPVSENLLTAGLAPEQPAGGLNAVAQTTEATPEAKMASFLGLKPTDITKPVVATVGSLLKQGLTQKRPVARAPVRPAGGLQMASAKPVVRKPATPPARMDVAKLIPIQKATPVAPPKTLASTAKLSPVTNIAGLTSLVKKTG